MEDRLNMIWVDKKAFEDTYSILKKEKDLKPIFADLKQFIEKEYGITVFNIIYEPIKSSFLNKPNKNSYLYGKKYRLICYVSSYGERETMQYRVDVQLGNFPNAHKMVNDENKQAAILNNFFELSERYHFPLKVKKEDIWVDYFYWFPLDYMSLIVSKIEKQTSKIVLSKYEKVANIWKIITNGSGICIFYQTESAKIINRQNGITEEIKNIYYSSIKEIDEFDFYKEEYIIFDSKENLDNNYQGNLYYYFK